MKPPKYNEQDFWLNTPMNEIILLAKVVKGYGRINRNELISKFPGQQPVIRAAIRSLCSGTYLGKPLTYLNAGVVKWNDVAYPDNASIVKGIENAISKAVLSKAILLRGIPLYPVTDRRPLEFVS